MIVLGIESSCDETAAAVVRDDGLVLSDVVATQIALHAPYGGVVPEIAARAHMTNIAPVIERALQDVPLSRIDAVAVTSGPGLVGALLVGVQAAKALAFARGLPIVGVNHLIGHLLSAYLHREGQTTPHRAPSMPFVALVASGGHTALYEVRSATDVEQLGQTRDDAAGECFDKVGKLLGLGYPGGPRIDKLAALAPPHSKSSAVKLPRPLRRPGNLEFSFSGLKTAVAMHVERHGRPEGEQAMAELCASFQAVVTEALVDKCLAACELRDVPRLVITGGVAANRGLRALAERRCREAGVELFIPPPSSCTDNGAMIAYAGACRLAAGADDGLSFEVFSRSPVLGAHLGSPALTRYPSSRLPRLPRTSSST